MTEHQWKQNQISRLRMLTYDDREFPATLESLIGSEVHGFQVTAEVVAEIQESAAAISSEPYDGLGSLAATHGYAALGW